MTEKYNSLLPDFYRSCILHHWLKFCRLRNGVRFQQKWWNDSPPYFPHYRSIKFSWWRKPGPMRGPWAEFKGSQFWGGPIQDWLIHSRDGKTQFFYITLLIPKTISISFDTSVQTHFHGRPRHSLMCSNSSALVLYNLENIKGTCQSGNQITANVKQGFGMNGWQNG